MPAWPVLLLIHLLPLALAAQAGPRAGPSTARDPLFTTRHFTTKDGLPHRVVNSIAQDQRGFIWLGTPQGLVRFDGHGFMVLTTSEGLASDAVRAVVCDRGGMLWVNYANGALDVLDPITLRSVPLGTFLERFPNDVVGPVADIISLNDGTIVFLLNREIFWYTDQGSALGRIKVKCSGWVDQLSHDGSGQVWCYCRVTPGRELPMQLVRTDLGLSGRSATARETFRSPDTISFFSRPGVDLFQQDPEGPKGIYVLMKSKAYMQHMWLPADAVSLPVADTPNQEVTYSDARDNFCSRLTDDLWLIGTRIRRMVAGEDPAASPIVYDLGTHFPHAELGQLAYLRDRTGSLWIGGEFGLFQVTIRPDLFSRFLWNGSHHLVADHRIRGLFVQGDRLHVNSETSGYMVLDALKGTVLQRDGAVGFGGDIISDGGMGFWRALHGGMVHHDANGRPDRSVVGIGVAHLWTGLALRDGSILLAPIRGLRKAGPAEDRSVLLVTGSPDLDQAWVAQLLYTSDDGILVCSNAGLFLIDTQGQVLQRWWTGAKRGDPHHLPTDDIRYAFADSSRRYWLATGSQGLLYWDRNDGVLRTVGRAAGFPTASIHAILPDRRGYLWMPTDNGLVRYQVTSGNVKVYTTADGLGFDEFNRLAYAQGPDGRMYFGGLNGITAFHPDDLSEPLTTIPAPLVLKSIMLQREEGDRLEDLTADVLAGIPARMEPKDRFLAVEMALLSYEDPKLLTYAWRIDGIDVDWNNQREPFLRLTALPYGDHLLRIKAQDAEGRWTEEVHVPITRAAPLHLRWWFIVLCVLLLSVAVFALVRYREQQLRRMIRMRDRIATDLHDEVGSNLSSIVLFSTAVGDHADTMPEYAAGMLQRIKDNSKRAMESMNDIVWSVNSGHDSMEDLLDRMRAFAEPLCEAAGITVEFDVDAVPLTRKLAMDQRKNLYLIFKEAVNNAVRHGRCKHITVTLRSVKGLLELTVRDDGAGMSETAARGASLGGNGLGNMARRAREVGGEVQVAPGHNGGTTVLFRFAPVDE